jgi:hypothetical protein
MSTYFKTLLSLTAVAGLFTATTAMADFRDHADSKAWTNFGRWSSGNATSRSYQSTAPVIVRSDSAPAAVAQAPTKERTYSFEPSQQGGSSAGCTGNAGSAQSPSVAQGPTGSNRSFSYEPTSNAPVVMGGRGSASSGLSIDAARHAKGY